MCGLILLIPVTVFGFVEKVGIGGGIINLQPENTKGKEFNIFLTSQKLDYKLSGEISIGYWDAGRTLSTRKLNWNGIFGGTGLRWYPWDECIYFGGGIKFHHTWMKDEHLPIDYTEKSEGTAQSLSSLFGVEIPIADNLLVEVRLGANYWYLSLSEDKIFEHISPMYYIETSIAYRRSE